MQRATKTTFGADKEKVYETIVSFREDQNYADVLKAYRKKNGLTQKELGEKLGVEEGTIRSWEKRYSKPPYHVWRGCQRWFDPADLS